MPENTARQMIMLHSDMLDALADPWQMSELGDGWSLYALTPEDVALLEGQNSATKRRPPSRAIRPRAAWRRPPF